jgi:hypothetical protein
LVFNVIVGTPPLAQRFTLHTNVFIQRSGFFRAARKPEWLNGNPSKPVDLTNEDPEVFQAYLNCVYRGPDTLKEIGDTFTREFPRREKLETSHHLRITKLGDHSALNLEWIVKKFGEFGELQSVRTNRNWQPSASAYVEFTAPESGMKAIECCDGTRVDGHTFWVNICQSSSNTARINLQVELSDRAYEELITLYLLADRLQDFETANRVIDAIGDLRELLEEFTDDEFAGGTTAINPGSGPVTLAYSSTIDGNLLRKLLREFWSTASPAAKLGVLEDSSFPAEFYTEIAPGALHAEKRINSEVSEIPRLVLYCRHYHQHYPGDSGYLDPIVKKYR